MTSTSLLSELNLFPNREKDLRTVTRYSLYDTMWYRTNLWGHSRRVAWITECIAALAQRVFGDSFDADRAIALALVHDDGEIIFGDVQAGNKSKMSKEELAAVEQEERDALEQLALRYPKTLGNFNYKSLLLEAVDRDSLEALVVTWADKYDAFGEALHELYAGNMFWTKNVENEYGKIPLPTQYYDSFFTSFEEKFPMSKKLFAEKDPWFSVPETVNEIEIAKNHDEHTDTSIREAKGYQSYDQWIQLTLERGTKEDISNLYNRKE